MKGRKEFSSDDAREIRRLLELIRRRERAEQKTLRARLRRRPLRFYITDWDTSHTGFTADDFDELVASGAITINAH